MAINQLPEGLSPKYCSGCGRFQGYEFIKKGYVIDYCKVCKSWTVHVGRSTNIEKVYKTVKPFLEQLTKRKKDIKIDTGGQKSPVGP